MTKDELVQLFEASGRTDDLKSALKQDRAKIRLRGVAGSAYVFFGCGSQLKNQMTTTFLYSQIKRPLLYFLSDLELLMGKKKVLSTPCLTGVHMN